MNNLLNYLTGEEIHVGDNVLFMDKPAEVVFVIERDEFTIDFDSQRDWYKEKYKKGIMLNCVAGLVLLANVDEMQFISRGKV